MQAKSPMTNSQRVSSKSTGLRSVSFFEYLSPFGVISTRELIIRLFAFLGLFIAMVIVFASFSAAGNAAEPSKYLSQIFIGMLCMSALVIWFLLATITKEYRTFGMPIPFIFALVTPFFPLMFILKYVLSSKAKRQVNQALADQQLIFRQELKVMQKNKKSYPSD